MLTRYWIEFNNLSHISPLNMGCGVTAESKQAALDLLSKNIFKGEKYEIKDIYVNIDISTLDKNHVLCNMGDPTLLGIWFPLGYN